MISWLWFKPSLYSVLLDLESVHNSYLVLLMIPLCELLSWPMERRYCVYSSIYISLSLAIKWIKVGLNYFEIVIFLGTETFIELLGQCNPKTTHFKQQVIIVVQKTLKHIIIYIQTNY